MYKKKNMALFGLDPFTGEFDTFDFSNPKICHGKGSGGGTNTTSTVTNSSPPPQVLAAYQQALGAASTAAQAPLQQYQGNIVAPFNQAENSAFGTIDNAQGAAQPFIQGAQGLIQQGTQPLWNNVQQFSPNAVQQYMSPYTGQVLNAAVAQQQNTDAQQQSALQGNAISSGAWGGDRAGVASAVLSGQQDLANNATNANILNTGYNTGLGEFNTQQQAQLGANEANSYLNQQGAFGLANLGQEALGTQISGANAQLASGQLQQQQNQAGLNVPYQQFLQQQAYPFQTAQYYANIAEGVGGNSGGTGTGSTTSPAPSTGSQIGGLGLGALGLAAAFAARGGRIKPFADGGAAGAVPDLSVSYVPTSSSTPGRGMGPPQVQAPKPYTAPASPSAASYLNAGKGLSALSNLFSSGTDIGALGGSNALDPAFASALDMGGESMPLDVFSSGALDAAGGIGDAAATDAGGDAGLALLGFLKRGGRVAFDTGGSVGGQTPLTSAAPITNPNQQTYSSSYQNMTPEQLQQIVMRLPAGSQQQKIATTVLQQKRTMPNVGTQAQGGFGAQQSQIPSSATQPQQQPAMARRGGRMGFDDDGDVPPPDPSQIQRSLDLQGELNGSGNDAAQEYRAQNGMANPPIVAQRQAMGLPTGSQIPMGNPPITGAMGSKQMVASAAPPADAEDEPEKDTMESEAGNAPNRGKVNPWLALAQAGFAMAGGTSPYAAVNIGRGAMEGIKNYGEQQKETDSVNDAADKLVQEAKQHKDTIAIEQQNADTNQQYKDAIVNQGKYTIGKDPITGTMTVFNSRTGQFVNAQPNGTGTQPFIDPSTGEIVGNPVATSQNPSFGGAASRNIPPTVFHQMATEDSKQRQAAVNNIPLANNILNTLDAMEPNFSKVDTGGYLSPAERAAMKLVSSNGQYSTSAANIDKGTNALATDINKFQYVPGMRGSVVGLQTILASKPGMDQPQQTNENIAAEIRSRVTDYQLTQNLAQQWREASPLKITDSQTYAVDSALKTLYPLQTVDPSTGQVTFNKDNVEKIKAAIPDAIANPQKYLTKAQPEASPIPPPGQRVKGQTYTNPQGHSATWTGTGWATP